MQIQVGGSKSDHVNGATWYALYTRHQHEKIVAQVLSIKGFDVFLPLYSKTSRWKDRDKQLTLPLFPCYVFLNSSLEHRLEILTTTGVYAFVLSGGRPAAILPEEIHAVRQLLERSRTVEPHPFLQSGDRVRVKSGPLSGLEGILVRRKNQFRLVISVEILGKSAATEVDVSDVERLTCKNEGQMAHPASGAAHVSFNNAV